MRYVRKPEVIEAIVWNGYDGVFEVIEDWVKPQPVDRQANDTIAIHTVNHGTKVAQIGDYVCKDTVGAGAVFVIKNGGFQLMYDPIEEDE